MILQKICTTLNDAEFERGVASSLATWPNVEAREVERTVGWVLGLRDEIVTLMEELADEEEITATLAIHYIELKSRWIALNTKMNYQTFRTGSCDTPVALRGAAVSALLGRVEGLLTQQDIDKITEFLAQPVRRAA